MTPEIHIGVLSLQVLAELKEYATEVDVDFVRKAVRAIGRCAIKVEASILDLKVFCDSLSSETMMSFAILFP